jgi:hypothetical protein
MARAAWKHPSVFVACPYTPAAQYEKFRAALDTVPIEFHYADSQIRTKHVLERIRQGIVRTDFSFFDITGWNANVTLELGLGEGLNKDYFILFRPGNGAKREPPSDLKGVQRFQYTKLDGFTNDCLTYQLNEHIVRKLTHPRHVYDLLSGENRHKSFMVAMRILAHFKRQKWLNGDELKRCCSGSYLRKTSVTEILEILGDRQLIKGRTENNRWKAGKQLYKNVQF